MKAKSQILQCAECGAKNRVLLKKENTPVCGKCKSTLSFPAKPLIITDANFNQLVERSGLPVLLDLWATWCPPCRMLAPIVDEIARDMSGKFIVGKLDVDKNPQISSRFGVQSIPTLLIFNGGREAERIVGLQSKGAIVEKLKKYF
jgi:thioredoxin 2